MKAENKKTSVNSVNSENSDLVAIARITKTRGLRGEAVADVLTDFPERFEDLERVFAVRSDGSREKLKVENFWFQKNKIILKFAGVDSIEAAENLRNVEICVLESEAVALAEDEYFDWELESCRIETVEGKQIGRVKEVLRTGGAEVLIVAGEEKEFMIPFAGAICTEVDIENKLIKIDAPEGLLEF